MEISSSCGTGGQTMALAQHVPGNITGIDLFPQFIDLFNANAAGLNLQDRVKGMVGSMDNLPFGNEKFDLIWSEGAIYTQKELICKKPKVSPQGQTHLNLLEPVLNLFPNFSKHDLAKCYL
jgi:hypothetical protein